MGTRIFHSAAADTTDALLDLGVILDKESLLEGKVASCNPEVKFERYTATHVIISAHKDQ